MEQPQRKVERLVLMIFSIYDIAIFTISVVAGWQVWVSALVLAGLIACWIVYSGAYKDFCFRVGFVTGIMQVTIVLYGFHVKEMYSTLLIFITLTVVVGLYGVVEVCSMFYTTLFLVFFYHILVKQRFFVATTDEIFRMVFQMLNGLVAIGAVHLWLIKKNKSNIEYIKIIEELKCAEQSKDDFLANVSHEIRTPINTICGMSEVILQESEIKRCKKVLVIFKGLAEI